MSKQHQCEGKKGSGQQCTYFGKEEIEGKHYCGIHVKKAREEAAAATSSKPKIIPKKADAPSVVEFRDSKAGNYDFLSNLYESENQFTYRGMSWNSAEHAFQAMKFYHNKEGAMDVFRLVKSAENAIKAREIALSKRSLIRDDWETQQGEYTLKSLFLFEILEQKFRGNFKAKLLSTSSREIRFIDKDTYWGTMPEREGRNVLGLLLMKLRDM